MLSAESNKTMGLIPAIIANTILFAILAYVVVLKAYYPDLYHRSVQEDEYLEWATFWGFILATGVWLWAAVRQRRSTGTLPWFLIGVGLFCFVVAMEEISWAQRIFMYRPPAYFLAENFQQEFNFHNVVATDNRKLALYGILFGYGVLLPALMRIQAIGHRLTHFGIVAPPLALAPPFAAALILSVLRPWSYTNETVELIMAGGFLFAAVSSVASFSRHAAPQQVRNRARGILVCTIVVTALGLATATATRNLKTHDPQLVKLAALEVAALGNDFLAMARHQDESFPGSEYLHQRVYNFVNEAGSTYLHSGIFAGLVAGGLPQERADFFLDPWNNPYWIKVIFNEDHTRYTAFAYSFGPNRRRESVSNEMRTDDIGAYIFRNIAFKPK